MKKEIEIQFTQERLQEVIKMLLKFGEDNGMRPTELVVFLHLTRNFLMKELGMSIEEIEEIDVH